MYITASLFAHIENDANLSGTYQLEGNRFTNTVNYLKHYLYTLEEKDRPNTQYFELVEPLDYLLGIEKEINSYASFDKEALIHVNRLATQIETDLQELKEGQSLLLPGGWVHNEGGHAMVYQFTRTTDGYHFTVVNAGAGLEYHEKKSGLHKELFNPTKTWQFPKAQTEKEHREIALFVGRLLKARALYLKKHHEIAYSETRLYLQTLPSISYIGGVEIKTKTPPYAYTGGQLSGTCAQRCLHQLLKINSVSEEEYQRFIFKFKQHALFDYVAACLETKEESYTPSVKKQIKLAIKNNLRILNNPKVFSEDYKEAELNQFKTLKNRLNNALFREVLLPKAITDPVTTLSVTCDNPTKKTPKLTQPAYESRLPKPTMIRGDEALLPQLKKAIDDFQRVDSPAMLFYLIEQLILSFRTTALCAYLDEEIKTPEDLKTLDKQIDTIQQVLVMLQNNWLREAQYSNLNVLVVCVAELQWHVKRLISEKNKWPDFSPFVTNTLRTILSHKKRNPFYATNNPILDERFITLTSQFSAVAAKSHEQYFTYLRALLETEPELNEALHHRYKEKFGSNISLLHTQIRKNQVEAVYMLSLQQPLGFKFTPLVEKFKTHFDYETKLANAIAPFWEPSYKQTFRLYVPEGHDYLGYSSPLYPSYVSWQTLSTKLTEYKYTLPDSPALDALSADVTELTYTKSLAVRTANSIQLKPSNTEKTTRRVTEEDLIARDFFYLRAAPSLQIALTLDYFTRNVKMLSSISNQRFVEANLFQPGLLLEEFKKPTFFQQFDEFLKEGLRFFNKDGAFTPDSVFFVHLDYQVSRYLYLETTNAGDVRLARLQEQLQKQLLLPNSAEVTYGLQQRLFLTLMTRIGFDDNSHQLFLLAFEAYHAIQSQTNPRLIEDKAHSITVEIAIAKFQMVANFQPRHLIKQALERSNLTQGWTALGDEFPVYTFKDKNGKTIEANILLGQFFERGLARASLPLTLQSHPLMKRLGLQDEKDCLMAADGQYMVLSNKRVRLFYVNNHLTVQKEWMIQGEFKTYELQALTSEHLARHASNTLRLAKLQVPLVLLDGSMDYWQETNNACALLVKNNKPLYSLKENSMVVLDDEGQETSFELKRFDGTNQNNLLEQVNHFEGNQFLLCHTNGKEAVLKLPRYALSFESHEEKIRLLETGEEVLNDTSPIHHAVAGLVLKQGEHRRYLVPLTRFYATEVSAQKGDFYPVVHDIYGTIANSLLEKEWQRRPIHPKPLWEYQSSEKTISFRLQGQEVIADTPTESLYLAYLYLATHKPKRAWRVLEDCNTRLGGLTGNEVELKIISWICNDLPYILNDAQKQATKATPPYVACQLKAMSLVCDFLLQDRRFNTQRPLLNGYANTHYAQLEYENLKAFQKALPETIYKSFRRLQKMGRHLEHHYSLSMLERKRLLDYYHQSKRARGALGYEWLRLSIETFLQEKDELVARVQSGTSSNSDEKRLEFIDNQLKQLKKVKSDAMALDLVSIDLKLPTTWAINKKNLSDESREIVEQWENGSIYLEDLTVENNHLALECLSSEVDEDCFILFFWTYFQIALESEDTFSKKILMDFCAKTLLANRHLSRHEQDSNLPFLCNMLYRAGTNCTVVKNELKNIVLFSSKFKDVVAMLAELKVPELTVYEVTSSNKETLAKPCDFLALERPKKKPLMTPRLTNTSILSQKESKDLLQQFESKDLEELLQAYKTLQAKADDVMVNAKTEEEAGKTLFDLEKKQMALAQELIKKPGVIELIQGLVNAYSNCLSKSESTWNKALALANRGPNDPALNSAWRIERKAKAKAKITKTLLMSLYCRADASLTLEKTGLDVQESQQLHEFIHEALVKGIQSQMIQKIQSNLELVLEKNDTLAAMQVLEALVREMLPGLETPATVIIQHEEEILLRPRQVSAIKALLQEAEDKRGFNECVEKIPPGGGKSKAILPVIAEVKAQGDNLVVIEVPSSLLMTNRVDFNRISQRLFGKRAYCFDFNRDSNCSAPRLEQLYWQFSEIMTTRSYLVTTGEAMQSLELKYLELLLTKDKAEDWEQQVFWCDKLIRLIHDYGDCTIDEVHQGLWLKKKLNYTQGEPVSLSPMLIKNAVALYSVIDEAFIKQAPALADDYDWYAFKTQLATTLIKTTSSPLYEFATNAIWRYGESMEQALIAYLTKTSKEMPEAALFASAQDKATLAFFKQQIGSLLPELLRRKLNVHYGASKRANLSPIETTLAIPYSGNNSPNEQSRFGNELEAMSLTIQMMLIEGLSLALLKDELTKWQQLARQELLQNENLKHLDDTPTARGFALLNNDEGALTLSQINVEDSAQLETLFKKYQHNKSLICTILQERSLKQIHYEGAILHSNSFNHVDMYRSVQGVSGTPDNHKTFHQRLNYQNASIGSDAYLIEILADKKTQLLAIDYQNPGQLIHAALTNSKNLKNARAIIDINATFTGVTNLDIAKTLALFIRDHQPHFSTSIKQVLYFNEEQILCALAINKLDAPIVLGTSDEKEVNRLLGSTPQERFTYYDETHTLGADIKQDETAHAIVLVDERISFSGFIQGCMRMRGLAQEQTAELIVPTRLKGVSLKELEARLKEKDEKTSGIDNLIALKEQMTNTCRRVWVDFITKLPSDNPKFKVGFAQKFDAFFVDIPSTDLFSLYGAVDKKQALKTILANHKQHLMRLCKDCVHKEVPYFTAEENEELRAGLFDFIDAIDKRLGLIIKTGAKYCRAEYEEAIDVQGKEVQVQKEVHKEVQVEQLALKAFYDPQLQEAYAMPWGYQYDYWDCTYFLNEKYCKDWDNPYLFSEALRVSKNYAQTYANQKDYCNVYLKPVFLVWYLVENKDVIACIITPQEANGVAYYIERSGFKQSWIATTNDTVIAGLRPEGMLDDKAYLALREQVRFFNGELSSLLTQQTPLRWLNEEPHHKIAYFESKLLPYRPGCETPLHLLKATLLQGNTKGFDLIYEHAFEDMTQFAWKEKFPNSIPAQLIDYQKLANAFVYLNKHAISSDLTVDKIQQAFELPLNSLTYIEDHLKNLLIIKKLVEKIKKDSKSSFLVDLSKEDEMTLEKCLGMSLPSFYKRHATEPSKASENQDSLLVAGIDALDCMNRNNSLQDTATLMDYFIKQAEQTNSIRVLNALLKINAPSAELIKSVLTNPAFEVSGIEGASEKAVTLLIASDFRLPQARLLQLAYTYHGEAWIESLLKFGDLNDEVLAVILTKETLNEAHLLLALQKNRQVEFLSRILRHPKASTTVISEVINSPAFTPAIATQIIHRSNLSAEHELLKQLTRAVFSQFKTCESSIKSDWEALLKQLIKSSQSKYQCDFTEIIHENKEQITCHLGFFILQYAKLESIDALPLSDMIKEAQGGRLERLLDTSGLSNPCLELLAEKCLTSAARAKWLTRTDINKELLAVVFANETRREEWLENLNTAQERLQKKTLALKGPMQQLDIAVARLKLLAGVNRLKSMTNKDYQAVADASVELYRAIRKEIVLLTQNKQDVPTCQTNCQDHFDRAKELLNQHRGYKQWFVDIFNAILAALSVYKLWQISSGTWRFFETKTKNFEEAEQALELIKPKAN